MLDESQKRENENIIRQFIRENKIIKPDPLAERFFLNNAVISFKTAKRLFELSSDKKEDLEAYMWVINISYYSMFYSATSLLAHYNHKIDSDAGIHKLTYHALVFYFLVDDNKLQNHFIDEYKESYEDAEQRLQTSKVKAKEFVELFDFEQAKRKIFTYDVGVVAEKNKASTSIRRAENFLAETRKIIGK